MMMTIITIKIIILLNLEPFRLSGEVGELYRELLIPGLADPSHRVALTAVAADVY